MKFLQKVIKYLKISVLPYKVTLPYTHVVQIGDPVLRLAAQRVNKNDIGTDRIQKIIKTMKSIMKNDDLTGISACQIGIPLSIIGFQLSSTIINSFPTEQVKLLKLESYPPQIWINPDMKILDYSSTVMPEMCSSLVSVSAEVKRHKKISLSGLDEKGKIQSLEASDFLARVIQHEMDHLTGTMFTDIMSVKSLKNPLWKEINELNGFVELNYYPKAK